MKTVYVPFYLYFASYKIFLQALFLLFLSLICISLRYIVIHTQYDADTNTQFIIAFYLLDYFMLVIQLKHPSYRGTCTSVEHKSGVYFTLKCHLERIGRVSIERLCTNGKKEENHTHHFSFLTTFSEIYGTGQHRIQNIIIIKAENILLPFNKTVEKYE